MKNCSQKICKCDYKVWILKEIFEFLRFVQLSEDFAGNFFLSVLVDVDSWCSLGGRLGVDVKRIYFLFLAVLLVHLVADQRTAEKNAL